MLTGIDVETRSRIEFTIDLKGGKRANTYRWEDVRCLIINLHVILYEISKTAASNVTDDDALEVMNKHVRSDHSNSVHREIRSFVTETFSKRFSDPTKDLFLDKIVELQ